MTDIYKVELKNSSIGQLPELYFDSQEAAECVINAFNAIFVKDFVPDWKCTKIQVMNKQDAFEQFVSCAKQL